jgi:hypothetical protein
MALILFGLTTTAAFSAASNSVVIALKRGVASENKVWVEWDVVLSNASPAVVRLGEFSLSGAVQGARFLDEAGHSWQVIRSEDIIDPPPPTVDFHLRLLPKTSFNFTLYTKGLERVPDRSAVIPANKRPGQLHYAINGDVEVLNERSRRFSRWNCLGNGVAKIEWPGGRVRIDMR